VFKRLFRCGDPGCVRESEGKTKEKRRIMRRPDLKAGYINPGERRKKPQLYRKILGLIKKPKGENTDTNPLDSSLSRGKHSAIWNNAGKYY